MQKKCKQCGKEVDEVQSAFMGKEDMLMCCDCWVSFHYGKNQDVKAMIGDAAWRTTRALKVYIDQHMQTLSQILKQKEDKNVEPVLLPTSTSNPTE